MGRLEYRVDGGRERVRRGRCDRVRVVGPRKRKKDGPSKKGVCQCSE